MGLMLVITSMRLIAATDSADRMTEERNFDKMAEKFGRKLKNITEPEPHYWQGFFLHL